MGDFDQVKRLIKENDLCVLATVGEDGPHCSLMSYLAEADCSHIFLVTKKDTQKFRNICKNSAVSLLIDDRDKNKAPGRQAVCALTLCGAARPCNNQSQKADVLARMKTERPHLAPIIQDPQAEVVIVRLNSWQFLHGVEKAHFQKMD